MVGVFSGADVEDGHDGVDGGGDRRADLDVVEHPVALLLEAGHVDGEGVRGTATVVLQDRLGLHKVRSGQHRTGQERTG